ncbi:hypothetical protein ZHAS_00020491 [Anopheles sinensis]|uniref:Uncharacterized protein n=1 Tax=Anopheles sinensis TaxID=74873 RepID=A0A084WPE5_ANOSI|nr:hypothetical protein ZHAS_00020491 [Anopheles sinensis]
MWLQPAVLTVGQTPSVDVRGCTPKGRYRPHPVPRGKSTWVLHAASGFPGRASGRISSPRLQLRAADRSCDSSLGRVEIVVTRRCVRHMVHGTLRLQRVDVVPARICQDPVPIPFGKGRRQRGWRWNTFPMGMDEGTGERGSKRTMT